MFICTCWLEFLIGYRGVVGRGTLIKPIIFDWTCLRIVLQFAKFAL